MAKDRFHEVVKAALIKDGWTITHDPLKVKAGVYLWRLIWVLNTSWLQIEVMKKLLLRLKVSWSPDRLSPSSILL